MPGHHHHHHRYSSLADSTDAVHATTTEAPGTIPPISTAPHSYHGAAVFDTQAASTSQTLFVDLMADLQHISTTIESVEQHVRVRRQQRRSVRASTGASAAASSDKSSSASRTSPRTRRKSAPTPMTKAREQSSPLSSPGTSSSRNRSNSGKRDRTSVSQRRKKDDDALDCIYAELQESVGMCRYWGKKCWNLRVPKAKGGFHSLCHMHRVKANDNQRRFDYKRRGTLWRSFKPDPNYEDISLFPGVDAASGDAVEGERSGAVNFEPFERPVPLQDKDVELLHELIGAAYI